ncbi:hypothetical protein GCM10027289_19920 [Tsukamurella serpentis]
MLGSGRFRDALRWQLAFVTDTAPRAPFDTSAELSATSTSPFGRLTSNTQVAEPVAVTVRTPPIPDPRDRRSSLIEFTEQGVHLRRRVVRARRGAGPDSGRDAGAGE